MIYCIANFDRLQENQYMARWLISNFGIWDRLSYVTFKDVLYSDVRHKDCVQLSDCFMEKSYIIHNV